MKNDYCTDFSIIKYILKFKCFCEIAFNCDVFFKKEIA